MPSVEPGLPQVGDVIDRYAVLGTLGSGGMATVYRVRHTRLGTEHAMKVLHLGSATIRQRLVQEGRVQATLKHPNLVTVTDLVDLEGGAPGVVMELVLGPALDRLLEVAPPDLKQADHLARGILSGVEEAHRHQIIHRDLKPANILLEPKGETVVPKITDFGIAKVLESPEPGALTRTGLVFGTPQYMSPEQMRNTKSVGPEADVFSLGAILYELVTHRRAFDGDDLVEIMNQVVNGRYV
ncbi:MAG: serine/threonine-protein kinase, partial [Myxococcota bacterium]